MTGDGGALAAWLQQLGHKCRSDRRSVWYDAETAALQACPYHVLVGPDLEQERRLLWRWPAAVLRYSAPVGTAHGRISYHVIYDGEDYVLGQLPKKARYDVRKALSSATVEPVPLKRMASEGWGLRKETLERQGRAGAESQKWWKRLCDAAEGLEGVEAWGAVVGGRLAASLVAVVCGDCYSILYQQSRTEYLSLGVNNALAFVVTQEAIRRPEIHRIFYGLHSLDAPSSVDEFKFRMGYRAAPVRQVVVFHPLLAPLVDSCGATAGKRLRRLFPTSPLISKAAGLMDFYLQGKLPLEQQDWPEPLLGQKAEILASVSSGGA